MAKLVVHAPGEPVMKLDLPPGLSQVGRSPEAHFQINHPSVSSFHCQIAVQPDGATITDLGSTNGTWLEGQRVARQALLPGQRLRLGEVDAVYDPPSEAAPVPPPIPPQMTWTPPPPSARAAEAQGFYQSIPGAFLYPVKHLGVMTLAIGSVLFLAFNALPMLLTESAALLISGGGGRGTGSFFSAAFGASYFGIGAIFKVLGTGYVILFMQSIITTSANGEERMPMYPLLENWWYDAVEPYLRLIGLLAFCLSPAVLCASYAGPQARLLTQLLGLIGFLYFPMALLALSQTESFLAVSPHIVIPSIARAPAEYGVCCLLFGGLMAFTAFMPRIMEAAPVLLWRYAVYQALTVEFVFLYATAVAMRLLGLFYQSAGPRLAWKA
ncbi:MAG TPA: FHA domain-containing protein [Verrucomicrobiae bacterium]